MVCVSEFSLPESLALPRFMTLRAKPESYTNQINAHWPVTPENSFFDAPYITKTAPDKNLFCTETLKNE